MRILLAAPHPFYQERGTPIAIDLLLRALSERGDTVDLLTYHEGEDRDYPGVTLHRISPPRWIHGVGPGPSLKKLVCDVFFLARMITLVRRRRYDVIHAVEEGAFMAMLLKPWWGTPFVYDMDSSMATQVLDRYWLLRPLGPLLRSLEYLPLRSAAAVVPVCEALATDVRQRRPDNVVVLKDVSLLDETNPASDEPALRRELGITGTVSMYIGNLESYQGIDLMLESFAQLRGRDKSPALVIIGGKDDDIARYTNKAKRLGVGQYVHFLGAKPVRDLAMYMAQADVLISPRTRGVNTPMKIYSYLHSGIPVLATDLPTHNQVLGPDIARLAPPTPSAFADAWMDLLHNPGVAAAMGQRAQAFIEREHSYRAFRETVNGLYDWLDQTLITRCSPTAGV